MNEEDPPTVLMAQDIVNFVNQFEEETKKPVPMVQCPSCSVEFPVNLTHYLTGQCEECFYTRKPWCQAAPVRDAYFEMMDAQ